MRAKDIDDFDVLIEDADEKADTDFEFEFINNLRDRYDEYEGECIVSEKQLFILQNMANK